MNILYTIKEKWKKFLKNEQNTKIDDWMVMKFDNETEHGK